MNHKIIQTDTAKLDLTNDKNVLERLGVRYFHYLSHLDHKKNNGKTTNFQLENDEKIVQSMRKISFVGAFISFTAGAISAWGTVYTELLFPDSSCDVIFSQSCLIQQAWVLGVTIVLTAIELLLLFWVALRTVFQIAKITGHHEFDDNPKFAEQIPNLLARAALEIPDPVQHYLGIDPLKHISKKKMLLIGIFYKLKIATSNVLARHLLRRLLGKSLFRISTAYIAVPITGLWNAMVLYKVARDARLRLFGNLLSRHIAKERISRECLEQLSEDGRYGCLQAVANSVVLTQNYHPNMLLLLARISELLNYNGNKILDDWNNFLHTLSKLKDPEKYFVLDLLAVSAAFDGKISKLEKKYLGEAFQEYTDIYFERIFRLKENLLTGRLNSAITECRLDFNPG